MTPFFVGLEKSKKCGNFCLVSARLSLDRHYVFTYYFQSSFFSDQSFRVLFINKINNLMNWIK